MKNSKENSLRWLRQAEYDLGEAEKLFGIQDYAYTCFFAEQSAQKSLKAFLINKGKRFINIHSVGELSKEASIINNLFSPLIDLGKKLDRHYLSARYPDALPPPAIPSESYVKDEAEEAIAIARKIFETAKSLIG
jgi:HEPN domain-containing protein